MNATWNNMEQIQHGTVEYFSTIERNRVLIHITMWVNLENIIFSEIRYILYDSLCMWPKSHILYDSLYMKYPEQLTCQRQKTDWWWPGAGEEGWRETAQWGQSLLWVMKMFATGWKWCLHNFVNVLNITKLFIFRLHFCYENFTSILKKNYKLN